MSEPSVRLIGRSFVVAVLLGGLMGSVLQAAAGDETALPAAVKNRDADAVRALLKQRVDVNQRMADGATALQWAAYWNDASTVESLIRAGADVNLANDLGVTPLFLASANGNAAVVSTLLAAGAKPDAATLTGETPIMTAARTGNAATVGVLAKRGANVNARESRHDQTALMWAAARHHADVIRVLLEARADISARSRVRESRAYLPSNRNGSGGTDDEHARLSAVVKEGGYTALFFATQQGDIESARVLLDGGADVNDTEPNGSSPLVLAAMNNHSALGALLLERGANPNATSAGYSALHAAILRGNLEFVQVLLARGANANAAITRATGARRYSADWGFGDTLIGATPAYLAATYAEIPILRLLLSAGANPTFAMPNGSTLIMAAMHTGSTRSGDDEGFGTDRRDRHIFARLLTTQSRREIERDTLEVVRLAIAAGCDVNAIDRAGDTAVHTAVSQGLPDVIEVLAGAGARLDVKNGRDETPLMLAESPRRRRGDDDSAPTGGAAIPDLLRRLGATQ